MTVSELIAELQSVADKSKSVFVWVGGEISPFEIDELSDRLDLNAFYTREFLEQLNHD